MVSGTSSLGGEKMHKQPPPPPTLAPVPALVRALALAPVPALVQTLAQRTVTIIINKAESFLQ
jgi:hypothetical protein